MKNFRFAVFILILLIGIMGCASIRYQVSARRDPFYGSTIVPSTFSFKSDPKTLDPVIEKKIQYLVSQTLNSNGWIYDSQGTGEFIFIVSYSMDSNNFTGSVPVSTYNYSTNKTEITQRAYSATEYHRMVKILVSNSNNPKEIIWSADCSSTGSTEDILIAAEYMVPYAINHFPDEGIWENSEYIER